MKFIATGKETQTNYNNLCAN